LLFAGADDGEFGADAAGGGEEDVARTAGDVGDAEAEEGGGGIGLLELLSDEGIEGVFEERLDEVVGRVVGAGGGAFVALFEGEGGARAVGVEDGLEFEEALIDGAELLDVEGGVVDADGDVRVLVFVEGEGAEAEEGGGVVEVAVADEADGVGAEEVTGERGDAEAGAGAAGFEELEAGEDGQPGVVFARVVEVAGIGEAADALETVEAVIEVALGGGRREGVNEVALFDDEQEEEAVDEAEELLEVVFLGEGAVLEALAEDGVVWVGEEAFA
jgi:hypothetical protein